MEAIYILVGIAAMEVSISLLLENSMWNSLKNPYGSHNSFVTSLVMNGSDLYAGGYCSNGR